MVNCWFGARWFGILGVRPSNNPFHKGIPGIQTTNPSQQLTISWSGFPFVSLQVIWWIFMNLLYSAIWMLVFFQGKKPSSKNRSYGSLRGSGFEPRRPGSAEECGVGNHFKRHRGVQMLVDGCHWPLVNVNFWMDECGLLLSLGFRKERILLKHEVAIEFISGMFCSPKISSKRVHHGNPLWRWKG